MTRRATRLPATSLPAAPPTLVHAAPARHLLHQLADDALGVPEEHPGLVRKIQFVVDPGEPRVLASLDGEICCDLHSQKLYESRGIQKIQDFLRRYLSKDIVGDLEWPALLIFQKGNHTVCH
jgi:hypothetical protein